LVRRETIANQEAFTRLRDDFGRHDGQYALMRSGMVIDFFRDRHAAFLVGRERFLDGLFSIHRVLTHERRHHDVPPLKERRMFWFR
jgi:hypothetical protein